MQSRNALHNGLLVLVLAGCLFSIGGCGAASSGLPDAVTITLPDGTETQATLGSGVVTLADTRWQFFATSGASQGLPFVTIRFDEDGNLAAWEDNTIASSVLGDTVLFDGQKHNTNQPPLAYAAATYGASTSDASGFAFEGRFTGYAATFTVATGEATASGTFDPDDPNVMTGSFSYAITILVDFPGVPTDGLDAEFTFIAHKVE